MPWSCEVLANALTLASPIAACYCARLLTRLFAQLEETSAIVANRNFPQSRSLACSGTEAVLIPPAPCRSESGQHHENQAVNGCFQYSNATFVLQSNDGSGVDAMDAEDEELDFCILTPQQALGVLGDHAPLYAKIFLNGYTFVADQSEPGTILSVDEYADRMHSSASRDQSLGGSSITCSPGDSQVADAKSDADASSRSMGGASSISHFSSISGSLSLTSCNLTSYISCGQPDYSSDPTVSRRSSFEVQLLPSKCSARIQLTRRTTLEEVNVEGSYFNTTSQTCPANLDDVSAPDKAQAHIWATVTIVTTVTAVACGFLGLAKKCLGKAPALPLPDGATLESAVPPALRYYLAQARAAGCQDPRDIGEGCEAGVRQRRSSAGDSVTGALSEPGHDGDVSISAGRPGFVRAAVEQLNTQRLVCCHVTPFTASKTSRKPRPLAHRVSASK
ncbi:hypothetical protein VOLCADRAFT_119223 [Volvox carteri f. nagariensis]|uniref:Uncharacterized protein n=1 Tax=Volvox carteri f. nagariensis TaxID=3068 RepID=D8UBJ2_VOLCA|nr:uncharacterized protein VOLCADRAFT_119223 [Volvox carteri f. nagariensis]EFJ42897.1 hypothetical protein VOLCADRAFT_119223 [Volvox carteri f. nagariensis]|eukprot:XP_002955937.1 hypothetical protein VOLCADRAFT_119223 [Volvox carteri f. nagariensis]